MVATNQVAESKLLELQVAACEWLRCEAVVNFLEGEFARTLPANGRPVKLPRGAVFFRRGGKAVEELLHDWPEAQPAGPEVVDAYRWWRWAWELSVPPHSRLRALLRAAGAGWLRIAITTLPVGQANGSPVTQNITIREGTCELLEQVVAPAGGLDLSCSGL
jgi:hypothetical protein